ncbi:MAG: ester cyclase [Anaerolineae bacterium]|nr:ester cyclase [Anaerolineae bacterium]
MNEPDAVESNTQVLQTFLELFISGQWDRFDRVIATDCVLHEAGGLDIVGLEDMKALWREDYAPLKDMSAMDLAMASEGDTLMTLYTMKANYEGSYRGQQISGVPVVFNQAEAMRIVNGKIVEWWVVYDAEWLANQLGFEIKPK